MPIFCSKLNTIQQWSIIYFQTFAHNNTIKIAVISWSTVRPNRGRISRLNTVSIDSFFHTHKPTGQIAAFRIVYGLTPPFGHYLDRVESERDFLYIEEKEVCHILSPCLVDSCTVPCVFEGNWAWTWWSAPRISRRFTDV